MTPQKYEELLTMVAPYITKSSRKREAIGPSERLSVTLRYLATGDAQQTIGLSYRISPTTIGRIVLETCKVLWDVLCSKGYVRAPDSIDKWRTISREFELIWNFPNCLGAIDGKHIVMQAPPRCGSEYFNYKKTHSIVLLAVCNAKYQFTLVDIGNSGRISDGGVFENSMIGFGINQGLLNMPEKAKLQGSDKVLPYVVVGDEAFPLKHNLMKPYPGGSIGRSERVFNYRLSRARRVIENTFGIAASRFRILRRPIFASTKLVVAITEAIVGLHNYLMEDANKGKETQYCPHGFVDSNGQSNGAWRSEVNSDSNFLDLQRCASNTYSRDAKRVRDTFREYFNSADGEVPWQWNTVDSVSNSFDRPLITLEELH
ncbi:protein ANTAGONIST OF LIKE HETEROCHROMATIN PROTEIN 1-like [Dendronephthya gigantea]|uniref:protein ANTAGONIST OF LIKE HETEROCHROMATIN PROTEIN 1-like n=1 Tax=Dendronephthya gigantea TaxID=151771 RepID=UPI00106C7BA4|nr:protein ANTAGONIST OF LIKE HETEROCHROMATIN PROTEIN 1-like [Dendronephthya gigantea]